VQLDLDARGFPARDWRAALKDGEDHELLFAADPSARVPEELHGTPVTRVGIAVAGSGCWVLGPAGEVLEAGGMGWEHV
jgi:thiamine monophosphate kinase